MQTRLTAAALAALALAPLTAAQGTIVGRNRVAAASEASARFDPCSPRPLTTPTYAFQVSAGSWQQCGFRAWPFSASFSPDGSDLFVPLFGGVIGNGGCTVARVDPTTLQLRGQIQTGESPEEVAFVTRPDGSLLYGFISDSSASAVVVFDDLDQVVATIPLPPEPGGTFPTAFPYGVITAPDQRTVYVGTLDGQGFVYAIDVATLQIDAARTIFLGAETGASRMAFAGDQLVIGGTTFFPNFTGSTARVFVVDPAVPQAPRSLVLASDSSGFLFPNPQDMAVACDGTVWLAGFDMGPRVYAIDPAGPTLITTVPTGTSEPDGKFQALGLSPDGLLAVADFLTDEIGLIDVRRFAYRETIELDLLPGNFRAAQEITFSPDGQRMLVPFAASDNIAVFDL
ncbi:MAG: hypothetical protein AAGA20_19300 [Planctomycetota bacterium]